MEIEYMKEFAVLAEILNFTKASRKLSISQPVLSKHIKLMENELGVQLFNRNSRSLELSGFGQLLLPYALQINELSRGYTEAISAKLHNITGSLVIGSIPSMSYYGIADIISDFIRENRNISVDITELDNLSLVEQVCQGKCDFAFARGVDVTFPEVDRLLFREDHYVVLMHADNPLSGRGEVTLADLKEDHFLMHSKDDRKYQLCLEAGFTPKVAYTNNSGRNRVNLVEKGMGIMLINGVLGEAWKTTSTRIVELVPRISTNLYLYFNSRTEPTPVAASFLEYVKKAIARQGS